MSYLNKMNWKQQGKRKDRSNHTGNYILTTDDGCDMDASDPEEQEDDCWEFWERNIEFYDLVVVHCKDNPNVDIDVHKKDGASDSE